MVCRLVPLSVNLNDPDPEFEGMPLFDVVEYLGNDIK